MPTTCHAATCTSVMRFVDANILELLTSYSMGDLDFESLEDLVIPLAWEDDSPTQVVVDGIAAEIALVKDGASDEATFIARIGDISASSVTPTRQA